MARPAPDVDKPTYEIAGTVERYDMRDCANARFELKPGTPGYEEYYSRHPEKKEFDDETKRLAAVARKHAKEANPVNQQFRAAAYYIRQTLGQKPFCEVDGEATVARGGTVDRVDVDPVEMTTKIKSFGKYLGAGNVRITKVKPEWTYTYLPGSDWPGCGKPVEFEYENLIYMVFPHGKHGAGLLKGGDGVPANIEAGWRYSTAAVACVVIGHFIRSLGWRTRALPPGPAGSLMLQVPTAVDAGLGEQGRTCHLVTKEFGNAVRIGGVATDMPLVLDKPVDFGLQGFCEKCHLCADYCPPGCIRHEPREVIRGVRRWVVDGDKCRRYRATIGGNCNICMAVCPWSHPNNLFHDTVRELAQNFSWLRRFLIQCEKIFYDKGKGGQYKRVSVPDWVTSRGTRDISAQSKVAK